MVFYHKRSVARALIELFPDIELDAHKLGSPRAQSMLISLLCCDSIFYYFFNSNFIVITSVG